MKIITHMSNTYYFRSYLEKYLIGLWGNRIISQVDIKIISKNIKKQVKNKPYICLFERKKNNKHLTC